MSLLAEIEAVQAPASGPRCGVALVLVDLPEPDSSELIDAMASHRYLGSAISKALGLRGITLPAITIQRHRRRECRCAR